MWWQHSATLRTLTTDFVIARLQHLGLYHAGDAAGDESMADRALSDPASLGLASLPFLDMAARFSNSLGLDQTGLADLLLARRSLEGWTEVAASSLALDDSRLHFHSSGSTGDPASHGHSIEHLSREARHFAESLGPAGRVVSLVPAHHIYGFLWSVLLPQFLGCPTERLSPRRHLPGTLAARIQANDIVVGTPDLWQRLLAQQVTLPECFTAVSSTAPLPPEAARQFRSHCPGARLVEVYGSTETAGIGWRKNTASQWELLPWWNRADDPGLATEEIVDRETGNRYPLNDHVLWTGERQFTLQGRRDPVVQIGGHNINLSRVRSRLLQHEDIQDAAVRTGADSLRFFLQLRSPPSQPGQWCTAFQSWLSTSLPDTPPASSIVIGERLPRNAMGKPGDWRPDDFPAITGRFRWDWPESLDSPSALQ